MSTNFVWGIFRIFLTDYVEKVINTSRPVVTICITRINVQQFYVLPTQCIYVFGWISEQTPIISLYSIN